MLQLTLIMVVGYIAGKLDILSRDMSRMLTTLVLRITLPALILSSVMNAESLPDTEQILTLFVLVGISYAVYLVFGFVAVRLFRFPDGVKGAGMFALVFGNVGYMGYPVTQAIWGTSVLFYTMVYNLPFNLLGETLGVRLIVQDRPYIAKNESGTGEVCRRRTLKQLLFTPIFITSAIAIFLAFAKWSVPSVIGNAAEIIGNVTTPVTMMIIGAALSGMKVREMFTDVRVYILTAIKLLVMPFVIWLLFRARVTDPLALGSSVVLAGVPTAALGQMLCLQYHGNEEFMAKMIFISVVCSVLTVPLIALLVL